MVAFNDGIVNRQQRRATHIEVGLHGILLGNRNLASLVLRCWDVVRSGRVGLVESLRPVAFVRRRTSLAACYAFVALVLIMLG